MLDQFIEKLDIAKGDCIILTGNFIHLLQRLKGNARKNLNLLLDIFSQKYLVMADSKRDGGGVLL
ncbi:hypothetical protein [Campylobacter aviculae]|uniref:Uncharacterized protein n=1 Tax=Campylobacter aviculae TaxID=2510190 RepID=A0A4U7BUZ8_9BACT|nr:hypothetical protein [Campylobacter aviculae]TKX32247.1 hypothetical protein CQA76_05025 [Campylobacter aviculae]